MIRVTNPERAFEPRERYALHLLVDLARLVPVDDPNADVVRLEPVERAARSLERCAAGDWCFESGDGVVRVGDGALRLVADLAAGTAEQRSALRDHLGRVPAAANPLVKAALEREPVVSRAAAALRRAVLAASGSRPVRLVVPWPEGRRWAAAVTHDLDVVSYWPLFTALRLVELARKGEWHRAARALGSALAAVARDPVTRAVWEVLDAERAHDVRSTWFVLCGTPSLASMRAGDLTYRPEARGARRILRRLVGDGAEIGLHGSLETVDRDAAFREQRSRLRELTGAPVSGVRQHFLRIRPGRTQRAMADAGFEYDSTAGFPDRNGFRLGVADVVPAWNAERESALPLDEVPFCWMDRALSKYRGIEQPQKWIEDAVELARVCRSVEGAWVGIWHPNLTPPLGYPDAPEAFAQLVRALAVDEPWFARMSDIVAWRRARRGVRVRTVDSGGGIDAYNAGPGTAASLGLETAEGLPAERVRAA